MKAYALVCKSCVHASSDTMSVHLSKDEEIKEEMTHLEAKRVRDGWTLEEVDAYKELCRQWMRRRTDQNY